MFRITPHDFVFRRVFLNFIKNSVDVPKNDQSTLLGAWSCYSTLNQRFSATDTSKKFSWSQIIFLLILFFCADFFSEIVEASKWQQTTFLFFGEKKVPFSTFCKKSAGHSEKSVAWPNQKRFFANFYSR